MRIYHHPLPYLVTTLAAASAVAMLIATLTVVFGLENPASGVLPTTVKVLLWEIDFKTAKNFAIAFWTVGPPIWFWFEYFWLFKHYSTPAQLEAFKHGQQVSASIWAGVVACILIATNFNPLDALK